MEKVKILFLAANPSRDSRLDDLRLDVEFREIHKSIRAAEYRNALELIPCLAVRPVDLQSALLQHQPHVLHFSGHGTASDEIILLDEDSQPHPVRRPDLVDLLRKLKDNLRLVVLNACFTKSLAEEIADVVHFSISVSKAIGDQSAIKFAAAFYEAIGHARSVQVAFDLGINSLKMDGASAVRAQQQHQRKLLLPERENADLHSDDRIPQLITQKGVDASAFFLVKPMLGRRRTELPLDHSHLPGLPAAYIAKPYLLLDVPGGLVGRKDELDCLDAWLADPNGPRVYSLVSIGGMGKSALTWHWFTRLMERSSAGCLWWSFYEPDANYSRFIRSALAYVQEWSLEETGNLSLNECEARLLTEMSQHEFLFVLDGFERTLNAYKTDTRLTEERLVEAEHNEQERHAIEKTADTFLKSAAKLGSSRILMTTRLFPAVLEGPTSQPIDGCHRHDLLGLSDEDSLSLWTAFKVSGNRDRLRRLFRSFGNHPLLIQVLAGAIANDRRTPHNFDAWCENNPNLDAMALPELRNTQANVLRVALQGLSEAEARALQRAAVLRSSIGYDSLVGLLVDARSALFPDERALYSTLERLENRALIRWDRPENRYDLHPIVRSAVWNGTPNAEQQELLSRFASYFADRPIPDSNLIKSVAELSPAIEVYESLIELEKYDEAFAILTDRLLRPLYRLAASGPRLRLLEMLFSDGSDQPARVADPQNKIAVLQNMGSVHTSAGRPDEAASFYRRQLKVMEAQTGSDPGSVHQGRLRELPVMMRLIHTHFLSGRLRSAVDICLTALRYARGPARHVPSFGPNDTYLGPHREKDGYWEGEVLQHFAVVLEACGRGHDAGVALNRGRHVWGKWCDRRSVDMIASELTRRALWPGDPAIALNLPSDIDEAVKAETRGDMSMLIDRLKGIEAVVNGNLSHASDLLQRTLMSARRLNELGEELAAHLAIARLQHRKSDTNSALISLRRVCEIAQSGHYSLAHADAFNLIAQIALKAGDLKKAAGDAGEAYRHAWCDGPPFAYQWGLDEARSILKQAGASEPKDLQIELAEEFPQVDFWPEYEK